MEKSEKILKFSRYTLVFILLFKILVEVSLFYQVLVKLVWKGYLFNDNLLVQDSLVYSILFELLVCGLILLAQAV